MKLFVDEDAGPGIGRALRNIDVDANHIGRNGLPYGTLDAIWMPVAASEKRLVLSQNLSIQVNDAQLEILIRDRLGFVFLPQHVDARAVMTLVLRWWDRIDALYERQPRPFAFFLGTRGRLTPLPLEGDRAALRRRLRSLNAEDCRGRPSLPVRRGANSQPSSARRPAAASLGYLDLPADRRPPRRTLIARCIEGKATAAKMGLVAKPARRTCLRRRLQGSRRMSDAAG